MLQQKQTKRRTNMDNKSKDIITINESDQLGEVVRETVEETLNKLLDAEADELCNAQRYKHSPDCAFGFSKILWNLS
jgi:putative transposase